MSRQREIEQGLRNSDGSLSFGLDVMEYQQGFVDYQDGNLEPRITSASYDLGRELGRRREQEAADKVAMLARLKADQDRTTAAVREMLKDRPDALAEFDERMSAIQRPAP